MSNPSWLKAPAAPAAQDKPAWFKEPVKPKEPKRYQMQDPIPRSERNRLLLNWLSTRTELRPDGRITVARDCAKSKREIQFIFRRYQLAVRLGLKVVPGQYLPRPGGKRTLYDLEYRGSVREVRA